MKSKISSLGFYRVRHLTFFSTIAYFLNGNAQLMSDLTDNQFYTSAERIWLIDLQKMPILAKKNKQNCRIWGTENPHAYIEKPTRSKRVTVWCGLGHFSSKMSKERPLHIYSIKCDKIRRAFNSFHSFRSKGSHTDKLCQFDLQKILILEKKLSFQMKLILILAGIRTNKIVAFGTQKTRTHTFKCRHTQNESLFGANFGTEA